MSHEYCRAWLASVMKEVKEKVSPEDIKKSWAIRTDYGRTEFQGPDEFIYHGKECCVWACKAEAWGKYLDRLEP